MSDGTPKSILAEWSEQPPSLEFISVSLSAGTEDETLRLLAEAVVVEWAKLNATTLFMRLRRIRVRAAASVCSEPSFLQSGRSSRLCNLDVKSRTSGRSVSAGLDGFCCHVGLGIVLFSFDCFACSALNWLACAVSVFADQ